jgi:MFS superfamily sulfate permease-like transporter
VSIPDVAWGDIRPLLTVAFSMFILILAQSAATSRAYAAKYGERFSEEVDLVGLGAANIGAALTGTYVVNGSPTKTQMVDSAGGRSQIASLTTAAIVMIVLLFLTKPLQYMPEAVLSAVVFLIGIELIKLPEMKRIYRVRPDEFVVALITAVVVVVVGVEQGILLAMALSIVAHVRRSYRPNDTVLVTNAAGRLVSEPVAEAGQAAPGLTIYRFGASFYYANANRFAEEVRGLVEVTGSGLRWFCLDASAVSDIDYSASETLREIHKELQGSGVRLVVAGLTRSTRAELDRLGITELVGPEAYFDSIEDVLEAYKNTKNSS